MFDKVSDYIHVENTIPRQVCKTVLDVIRHSEWKPNSWYNPVGTTHYSEAENEPDMLFCPRDIQDLLHPFVVRAYEAYAQKFAYKDSDRTARLVSRFSFIRFNRYGPNQLMRKHHDHIHSIFDGQEKGIPVLSFVGNLNEDYEGGELAFFDGEHVESLKAGDICMFPSCFLYPHEAREVRRGQRYSFAVWGW